ncbi:MAG TPA: hypothetical protein VG146_01735 [Verrucomicrobiae bacterium]|nr:hypothetical protein [Verrucomicrobiae bacterium]
MISDFEFFENAERIKQLEALQKELLEKKMARLKAQIQKLCQDSAERKAQDRLKRKEQK